MCFSNSGGELWNSFRDNIKQSQNITHYENKDGKDYPLYIIHCIFLYVYMMHLRFNDHMTECV